MPSDEPSNAVLAALLRTLQERAQQSDAAEAAFHVRLEGRLDTLVQLVGDVNKKVAVNEERISAQSKRITAHEAHHVEEEKQSRHTGTLIVGGLTIAALIVGSIVTYIVR